MTPFRLIYLYINIKLDKNQICVVKIIQGGGVAAPVAGQILGEVLPYLEISREEKEITESIEMPNVTGMTFKEAKNILKEAELEIGVEMENEAVIKDQLPKPGIVINKGTEVILYGD